jgi:hypothetical protein
MVSNIALELTGLSCAKFEAGFAVAVRLLARPILQSRPAAQLSRYAAFETMYLNIHE